MCIRDRMESLYVQKVFLWTMKQAAVEPRKGRIKYRCPKITAKGGTPHCTWDEPCSDAKYGRNVHLVLKDNPRLFNTPPRGSEEWKLEYNARTSAERCNKREKIDYKLEDGRYRSSMMLYCRLFAIMMCQHLDAVSYTHLDVYKRQCNAFSVWNDTWLFTLL